ncbi:MAG TPA: SPOR domain-containing protein [Candidatus Omnitrophota bacterium]|nr:SPOR domain-containing protein [Candidatus Omnitrophota bacterium]
MTEIKQGETQQELFGEFASKEARKPDRFPSLNRAPKPIPIYASIDQIILVSILMILLGCFVFFLGVLRGKSLASQTPLKPAVQKAKAASTVPLQTRPVTPQKSVTPRPAASQSDALQAPTLTSGIPAQTRSAGNTPPAADLTKPYTIQLVTFKKQDLADKEVAMLKKRGLFAFIIPSAGYFQVCAGQYASKDEARKDLKSLASRYKDCFLRRR